MSASLEAKAFVSDRNLSVLLYNLKPVRNQPLTVDLFDIHLDLQFDLDGFIFVTA